MTQEFKKQTFNERVGFPPSFLRLLAEVFVTPTEGGSDAELFSLSAKQKGGVVIESPKEKPEEKPTSL